MTTLATNPRPTQTSNNLRKVIGRIALYISVITVSLITFFPIYWMIVCTIQPNQYTLHFPPPLFPQAITFGQFAELFANHPVALWLRNSFIISLLTMLVCMILSIMGAYALS